MFHLAQITKWQDGRDSSKRTHKRDIWGLGYREFLINPNRIVDLKVHGAGSCFRFSDNHRDRREANSYVETNSTVAEIEVSHNLAFHSKFITLPFFPKNNHYKTPIDTTLDVEDIAYFDDYNDPDHPDHDCCWVVYTRKAFRRVEQLVNLSLRQVEDIAETGTTSTTTTTTARGDQEPQ
jgi:hypothetical protein